MQCTGKASLRVDPILMMKLTLVLIHTLHNLSPIKNVKRSHLLKILFPDPVKSLNRQSLCRGWNLCKMQLQICGEDYRFVCSVWWGHRRSFNQSTSLPPVSLALEAGISSFSYLEILLAFCFFVCSKLPAKRNYFNNALISLDSLRGFSQRLFASFKTNLDLVVDYRNFYWNSLPIIPWANCILQFKRRFLRPRY